MKNKKFKINTVLVSALATTAVVTPVLASCSKKQPEIETKYFEIVNGELKGFKPGITDEQKKELCKDGKLKLPAAKIISTNAFAADLLRDAPFASEIIIDASTEEVGERAFFSNTAKKITWNGGVAASKLKKIGRSAFAFCKNLESFEMPAELLKTSITEEIADGAFFSCSSLNTIDLSLGSSTEVNLPKWSSGAFRGIPKQGNVILGNAEPQSDLEKIVKGNLWSRLVYAGVHADWKECYYDAQEEEAKPWATQIKVVPTEYLIVTEGKLDGVNERMWKQTEPNKFDTVIAFDSNITTLGDDLMTNPAKFGNKALKYFVLTNTKVTAIPNNFCANDQNTTQIYWPETLQQIGANAFESAKVTNVFATLANISAIGASAFKNCETIKEFTFAKSDVTVGDDAFNGATKLETLDFSNYGSTKPTWTGTTIFTNAGSQTQKVNTIKINVPSTNPVDIWRLRHNLQTSLKGMGLNIEPSGEIPNAWHFDPAGWFSSIDQLLDIDENGILQGWAKDSNQVPMTKDEVTAALAELKFDGTWNLPASCRGVADNAFFINEASSLPDSIKTINFKSVVGIGKNAFKGATGLTTITLYKSCQSIADGAFQGCTALANIKMNEIKWDSLSSFTVGNDAFTGIAAAGTIGNAKYDIAFDQWHLNYVIKTEKFKNLTFGNDNWKFENVDNASLVTMDEDHIIKGLVQSGETGPITDDLLVLLAKDKYGNEDGKIKFRIPAAATGIADNAFINDEKSLIPDAFNVIEFEAGSNLASIGNYAFFHCGTKGTGITLNFANATNLKTIGNHAFGLSNIVGTVALPASITDIGEGAFYENNIVTLVIPKFTNATGEQKITFSNGCFAGNKKLENIDVSAYTSQQDWDDVKDHLNWEETVLDSIATIGQILVYDGDATALNQAMKDFLAEHSYTINEHYGHWMIIKKA